MTEVSPDQLKEAVESQHGGTATFVQAVPVRETHNGETVWDGVVHVFDLAGHPTAKRAYAWSYERGKGRVFFAVLHVPPITSPRDAVRAAIVAEARACEACGGTGTAQETRTPNMREPKKPIARQCPDCGGTGKRRP